MPDPDLPTIPARSAGGGPPYFKEANLGLTDVVRQHYVPRFLLERFAEADGLLRVQDLQTGNTFRKRPAKVAHQRRFNDLVLGGVRVSTEPWLAQLEGEAATAIAALAANPDTLAVQGPNQEQALARYIAAQRFRVPVHRQFHKNTREQLIAWVKEMAESYLQHSVPPDEADKLRKDWAEKPDEWWLHETEAYQEAESSAFMLSEVQGFSNLLRAVPWRIGRTAMTMYTSDNPVSAFLPSTHFPGLAGFPDHVYFFPISTDVLLKIGPPSRENIPDTARCRGDFGEWETSIARHVVSREAGRFLYGPPPYVTRSCAEGCLAKLNEAKLRDAVRLQGFDPTPPWGHPMTSTLRSVVGGSEPNERGLYEVLWDYLQGRLPLSAIKMWIDELHFTAGHPSATVSRKALILQFVHSAFSPDASESEVRRAAAILVLDLFPNAFDQYLKDTGKTIDDVLREIFRG